MAGHTRQPDPFAEWLEIAREHNLTTQLSPEDLIADAETAREL